jgi:hypothetical protein
MQMTNTAPSEASRGTETKWASLGDIAGIYAFRFSGYTMLNNIRYFLVGVGQFKIATDGTVSGSQKSSITPLQGQKATLDTAAYKLAGTINLHDGAGDAFIHFTKTEGSGLDVDGKFFVQMAGSADRLWFISAGASLPKYGTSADELVTLEAVRIESS